MSSVLDYLTSVMFGGALLSIILSANDIASENQSVYNGDMLVQQMLVETAYMLEGEFRNMGVGVPENDRIVRGADTSNIAFLSDIDRNGTPDTVRYYLGATSEMSGTQNPLDRPLYRTVNNSVPAKVGVVTVFRMMFMTRTGEVLATPVVSGRLSEVHSVEITMEVQNPYATLRSAGEVRAGERNALFSSSLWQQTRLASQNMKR